MINGSDVMSNGYSDANLESANPGLGPSDRTPPDSSLAESDSTRAESTLAPSHPTLAPSHLRTVAPSHRTVGPSHRTLAPPHRRTIAPLLVLLALCLLPLVVMAQGRRSSSQFRQAVEYDGNLAFTRVIYGSSLRNFGFGGAAWSHDYPAADRNLSAIIDYITHVRVRLDGTNVLDLDDPEIFQNPVLYVWEPGFWTIEPSEARQLREYLLKGGLVIFDDFEGPDHWANMVAQMRQALPEHEFIQIDERHPIFHSFYDIRKLDVPHPSMDVPPGYWAMFENNDPSGRMIALANHNNDIAEYWEWSAEGLYNPDPTSNAYRLGVNYYVYALTH